MNDKNIIIKIRVKPNAPKNKIEEYGEGLKISLKSVPEKNKANKELIKILSDHFKVSSENIKIISGKTSKNKLIKIIK